MFIIHVDLDSMTITSIESSTLLPITTAHYLPSELFISYGLGIYILFSLSLFFFPIFLVTYTSVKSEDYTSTKGLQEPKHSL